MRYVRKVSSPYNVNGVALDCLPVALADEAYVQWYAEQVRVGLARMMDGLRALGVGFFPSHANFVLMKIGPKHAELVKAMRAHGVLLRDRSADPGCDGYVRITIGVEEHVTRGLAALEGVACGDWMEREYGGGKLCGRRAPSGELRERKRARLVRR
jgi:histidinol-phosphate aminotransferase